MVFTNTILRIVKILKPKAIGRAYAIGVVCPLPEAGLPPVRARPSIMRHGDGSLLRGMSPGQRSKNMTMGCGR